MSSRIPCVSRLVVLATVMLACGCTVDEEADGYVKISGRVSYRDQPIKKGTINFVPVRLDGIAASGEIDDGTITRVTTHMPGDGVMAGQYTVTIVAFEQPEPSQRPDRYNGPSPAEVAALVADTKTLIPLRYSSVTSSDLRVEVSPSRRMFQFDLKD